MRRTPAACLFAAALLASPAVAEDFALTSSAVGADKPFPSQFVYDGFGCTGGNQSFPLQWSGAPAGAQSFAITHFDPGALRGRGFWHWFVVNLPATTTSLPADAGKNDGSKLPAGARQLTNGFRKQGYSGSCPPPGDAPHRYVVTVYALKTPLELPADATPATALPLVEAAALGKATLTYEFARP
jgi:Raf kinase inhibitor-like YbhB/YbcL family protein